jgi:hypothetical protein
MKREMTNTIKPRVRSALVPFAMLATLTMTFAYPGRAQQTFPSAAQASQSLFQAVQNNNPQAIGKILGGPRELASSGDELQDKLDSKLFGQKYREMHRLVREADGSVILYIGAENWPFPVPLVEKNGAWHFDSDAGLKEVLFRRIGENELAAIEVCHEFAAAEKLYRPPSTAANPAGSFAASLAAQASSHSTGGNPALFQGYYFRVLTTQATGGFTLIAYPAEYRSCGVMSFIVTENGIVYEKDLGANTSAIASAMATFHRDATWQAAGE